MLKKLSLLCFLAVSCCSLHAAEQPPIEVSSPHFRVVTDDLSALGFNAPPEMNPFLDIEGMKARVQYVESSDHTIDGQVLLIELRK
jgi:hypothetical protein